MAKLETQINQIFLTHPEVKNNLQILHDEEITASSQLFVVAELRDIKRKTDEADLKKICEIIFSSFRGNKKMSPESLFETALAQTNESLADLAHKGRKSWLNKFSAVIALKNGDNVYLANTGNAKALLKRKTEVSEILAVEKRESHPLKTFQNFTMGKVKEFDCLTITLSNFFDYVSLNLFIKTLNETEVEEAVVRFSQILKDSAGSESFACFILKFSKQPTPAAVISEKEMEAVEPQIEQEVYAPLPETEVSENKTYLKVPVINFSVIRFLSSIKDSLNFLPKNFNLKLFSSFKSQSTAKKFFLISFIVFILLFGIQIIAFGFQMGTKKHREKVENYISTLTNLLNEAEGSLIYKNDNQAFEYLNEAWVEFEKLKQMEEDKAAEIEPIIKNLSDRINRISKISNPELVAELRFPPEFMARAGSGFLIAGKDSKELAFLNSENKNSYIFLLNNPSAAISGIAHVPQVGHVLVAGNSIYRINEAQKQVEVLSNITNGDLYDIKLGSANRVYTIDKNSDQILRFNFSANGLSNQQTSISGTDLAQVVDFGLDKDIYLLLPDKIKKFVNGSEQAFSLPAISDPMENGSKLMVGNNLYVLESNKKRLLIYSKQGSLLNQIIFSSTQNLADFYIDELQRNMYILDGNKILRITF